MKLNKRAGCVFGDRIDIEVSPSQLSDLIEYVKEKAMAGVSYGEVGIIRELKDLLQERYDEWRCARDKKDEENK